MTKNLLTTLVILLSLAALGRATNELESGFSTPPARARPYVWWHWMNGNVTREGITADLEALAEVGVGGAWIFNMGSSHGCNMPAGPLEYMSDEWLEMIKFAVSEARRLGLGTGVEL